MVRKSELVHVHISGPGLRYNAGKNQSDWNKLPGGDYFSWLPHGRTAMVGWRYNIEWDAVEFTPYYHNIENADKYKAVGAVPGYVNEKNIYTVPIFDNKASVAVRKEVFKNTLSIEVGDINGQMATTDNVEFSKIGRFKMRSNGYAGGQYPAEQNINFEIIIF